MMWDVFLAILIGVTTGVVTGLTPGVHVNLVSAFLISLSVWLIAKVSVVALTVFIIAMCVTHTFLDSIPSVFLGAPDSATALGVLPGHRYLLKGRGYTAIKLTVIGSFGALILSIFLFPLFIPIVKFFYPFIKNYIGHVLVCVVVFMILRDNKQLIALFVFLLSGLLGLIVLNTPNLKEPLFGMLSGLFGVSTLVYSLSSKESIPLQKTKQNLRLERGKVLKALFSGQFSGFITAVFPGLGSAQAAIISMQITRKLGDYGFMILIGSINTVNFLLSLVTLLVLNKARNGAIIAVSKLIKVDVPLVIIFLLSALIAGSASVFLALNIAKGFSKLITKVNYQFVVISIIVLIIVFAIVLSGFIGLIILIVSSAIGLIPAITKTSRTHAMGCLLLPVILFFLL